MATRDAAAAACPGGRGRAQRSGLVGALGEHGDERVQQLAYAAAVQRGEGDRLAEPEREERVRVLLVGGAVGLVRRDEHGRP